MAFSIFLDLVEFIEGREANSHVAAFSSSGYSVEDLPSYYMSFYLAQRLEADGLSDLIHQRRNNQQYSQYMTNLAFTYLGSCNILTSDLSREILNEEPSSARSKNLSFLPVDRADSPAINRECGTTRRGSERIPSDIFTLDNISSVPINMLQDWTTIKGMGQLLRVNRNDLECIPLTGVGFPFEGANKTMDLFECRRRTTARAMTPQNLLGYC